MKKSLLAFLLLPMLAWAEQSLFDGTWKIDLNSAQFAKKPVVLLLQYGVFHCSTCDPQIDVKADGTEQPIEGSKSVDTMVVKIVNDRTLESTSKKDGKVVSASKSTVTADGKTTTLEFTDYPMASNQPVTGKIIYTRVASGPPGSHLVSGSWRIQKVNQSENALILTLKSSADGLMMSRPIGESVDAKFDGKDYPVKGAPAGYTVSLSKQNDRSIVTTTKRDGKVVQVEYITVSADGKSLSINSENKAQDTTTQYTAIKQ
jgi:hypothetical protein